MSIFEHLANATKETPEDKARWNSRTVESIADAILQEIADDKRIVGCNASDRPRLIVLTREMERNAEFRQALYRVAETVLGAFPNPPNGNVPTDK